MTIKRNPTVVKRNDPKQRQPPLVVKRNPPGYYKMPVKNMGGHLPDPPDDCERKDMWKKVHDQLWIDLSSCHSCSIIKDCHGRSTYLAALKKQREEHIAEREKTVKHA